MSDALCGGPMARQLRHRWALKRIDELMDAERGTPEGDELDRLVSEVQAFEAEDAPQSNPAPVAVARACV